MTVSASLKYFEGGNRLAVIAVPVFGIGLVIFYDQAATFVGKFGIDAQVVYSYVFNIFAIEFGALLSLFALLACRPTQYLERIRNTMAFRNLMSNIKITLSAFAVCIFYTFALGVLKLEPGKELDFPSMIFLAWFIMSALVTIFYARTIRLTFLALT